MPILNLKLEILKFEVEEKLDQNSMVFFLEAPNPGHLLKDYKIYNSATVLN